MADKDLGLIQLCKVLDGSVNGGGGNWRVGVTWRCWGDMEVLGWRSPGMSWRVCGVVWCVVTWRCWARGVGG